VLLGTICVIRKNLPGVGGIGVMEEKGGSALERDPDRPIISYILQ